MFSIGCNQPPLHSKVKLLYIRLLPEGRPDVTKTTELFVQHLDIYAGIFGHQPRQDYGS